MSALKEVLDDLVIDLFVPTADRWPTGSEVDKLTQQIIDKFSSNQSAILEMIDVKPLVWADRDLVPCSVSFEGAQQYAIYNRYHEGASYFQWHLVSGEYSICKTTFNTLEECKASVDADHANYIRSFLVWK